uniref:ABC transporter ATP-binding protein n=1 Tax=Thermosporothrix sp. COM3 TaxID=2490863 RepID=A0A455SEM3_9CHLR|nr:ABC transporter ATP-binding protein [Thermosporothrix sp. COM3]
MKTLIKELTKQNTARNAGAPLLKASNLTKSFKTPEGQDLHVLENINLTLHEGEIVALLGRSGSGKSTLLRSLIGLITPTTGSVTYRNRPVVGPMPGMAMVFQTFALFPWLTVQQNVELGLETMGVPAAERARRALEAIDIIGLDGFESAYPKELSGGMRQRVGFARALVTNPDILFMDEPFSALDVLTAERLRSELLELWQKQRISMRSLLIVTHNIEEAVIMADRIVVLSANPGRIRAEIPVTLPRPRNREQPEFRELVEHIYTIMTTPEKPTATPLAGADRTSIAYRLPGASIEQLGSLLELLAKETHKGRADLPYLASSMQLEVDDLFPLTDAAELLGFARVEEGDIILLPTGQAFARGDTEEQKQIFASQLIAHVPLVTHIQSVLHTRPDHRAPEERFLRELEDFMSSEDAETLLSTAIDWGRYAELFAYDYNAGVLSLESEQPQA